MPVLTPNVAGSEFPNSAFAVTPSDSANISADAGNTHGYNKVMLFVGVGGDVKVTMAGGTAVTFKNVASGQFCPITVSRVWSTGTTATNIVAIV